MRSTSWIPVFVLSAIPVLVGAGEGGCESRTPVGEDIVECGDGVIEGEEQCDLGELAGQDCEDHGFVGGTLTCDADCRFDTSGCSADLCSAGATEDCICTDGNSGERRCEDGAWTTCECEAGCGDGVLNAGEDCDETDLGGQDCTDLGFTGGELSCRDDCRFDSSGCTGDACTLGDAVDCTCDDGSSGIRSCVEDGWTDCECEVGCGNGVIEADLGEECDLADLDDQTCVDLGFESGELACTLCFFDTSGCTAALIEICDNDRDDDLDELVDCDDPDCGGTPGCGVCLAGETVSCLCDDGRPGIMRCVDGAWGGCGECASMCGDGICDPFETPESCSTDCDGPSDCGDGDIDMGEDCDLTNLGGQDCTDQGFTGGELACTGACTFDTTGCSGGSAVCGDGSCDAEETETSCPVDCMAGLPTEGEACADVAGEWLCAAGHTCISVEGSRFCYLEGCDDATDCSESIIEDSQVASPDFGSGLRAQCWPEMGDGAGACVGYRELFFAEEGSLCAASIPIGPEYFCHQCGPLSVCLPDEYFDADPFSPWPLAEDEMRCRRHCTAHEDCDSGRCLFLDDLSTDDYACVLSPTGYCCLPGDDDPDCL